MLGGNNYISTVRIAADSDGHDNYSTAVLTTYPCYIQRMSLSQATLIDAGNPYEVFELVADSVIDLKENDQVTDKNSKVYRVSAVQGVDDFIQFTKAILVGVIS